MSGMSDEELAAELERRLTAQAEAPADNSRFLEIVADARQQNRMLYGQDAEKLAAANMELDALLLRAGIDNPAPTPASVAERQHREHWQFDGTASPMEKHLAEYRAASEAARERGDGEAAARFDAAIQRLEQAWQRYTEACAKARPR